jgi:hypothetical protein
VQNQKVKGAKYKRYRGTGDKFKIPGVAPPASPHT